MKNKIFISTKFENFLHHNSLRLSRMMALRTKHPIWMQLALQEKEKFTWIVLPTYMATQETTRITPWIGI